MPERTVPRMMQKMMMTHEIAKPAVSEIILPPSRRVICLLVSFCLCLSPQSLTDFSLMENGERNINGQEAARGPGGSCSHCQAD